MPDGDTNGLNYPNTVEPGEVERFTGSPLPSATPIPPGESYPNTLDPGDAQRLSLGGLSFNRSQPEPDPGFSIGDMPFLPANPKMRPRGEPYIPLQPARPPAQWGRPDSIIEGAARYPGQVPGPYMPQAQDIGGLLRSIFTGLGKNGSPQVRALLMAAASGHAGWVNSYIKGLTQRMQIQHQLTMQNLEAADERQRQESERYGIIMGLYPNDEKKRHEELRRAALDMPGGPDTEMLKALDNPDHTFPERLQQQRDAHWLSLRKYNVQSEKMKEAEDKKKREEDDIRRWRTDNTPPTSADPDTTTPSPTATPTPDTGTPDTGTPEEETPGIDIPGAPIAPANRTEVPRPTQVGANPEEAPPYQVAGPVMPPPGTTPPPPPAPAAPIGAAGAPAINFGTPAPPAEEAVSGQLLRGDIKTLDKSIPAPIREDILRRTAEKNSTLDQIIRSPLKGVDVYNAVKRVDAQLAEQLNRYVSGRDPVPRGAQLGRAPWNRIAALAQKWDPRLDNNTFATRGTTMKDFVAGTDGRSVTAALTAYHHIDAFVASLRDRNFPNWLQSVTGQMRGVGPLVASPEIRALIGRLENEQITAASEYERALVNGKPAQTARNRSEGELDWRNKDTAVVIANALDKKARLRERVDQLINQFAQGAAMSPAEAREYFIKYGRGKADDAEDTVPVMSPDDKRAAFDSITRDNRPPAMSAPGGRRDVPREALDELRSHRNDPVYRRSFEKHFPGYSIDELLGR